MKQKLQVKKKNLLRNYQKNRRKNTDKSKESSKQNDNNKVQPEENKPTPQAVPGEEKQPEINRENPQVKPEMEKQSETKTPGKEKESTPKLPEKMGEKNTDKSKESDGQSDNNAQSKTNTFDKTKNGLDYDKQIKEVDKQKEKSKLIENIKTQDNNKTMFKLKALSGDDKITVEFDKVINANEILFNEIKDHKLINNIKEKLNVNYVRIFDIDLLEKGKVNKITDNRTVRVALAGENMKNIGVYHIKNNGELEKIQSKEENGELVFKTNHFSKFAFVNKVKGITDIINNNNSSNQIEIQEQKMSKDNIIQKNQHSKGEIRRVNHNIEKLPNTGKEEKGLAALGAFIVMALTFILFKRKE
ncbi:LPXTG cell wall anchor domain-containing protein [Gemella haemolysans]|uniref:Gram-positive cocci surface proteins LPxTG domain-containing protein n=1 Tax=Gemella haemolysans M341 TaxID=562981 RepID=A0AA87AQ49_9BACL|nr:LPXTG cell wall anchor domain-containing protein [Gemella haemolysans]EGF88910.1 hypothetical protein HMPREF0428_00044 [Gemella haemolysans M341]